MAEGYYTERNGQPVQKRQNGGVRRSLSLSRFKLPACVECNEILSQRFERQATVEAAEQLFGIGSPTGPLAGDQVALVAEWMVKTWVLLAHPAIRNDDPGWTPKSKAWTAAPPLIWSWLTDGSPPPDGLTLWLARVDGPAKGTASDSQGRILLPTVKVEHGAQVDFLHFPFRVAEIASAIVFHPGWPIEHPFEVNDGAVRLWPDPPVSLNPAGLTPSIDQDADDFQRLFQPGPLLVVADTFFDAPLPPLRVRWHDDTSTLVQAGVRGLFRGRSG